MTRYKSWDQMPDGMKRLLETQLRRAHPSSSRAPPFVPTPNQFAEPSKKLKYGNVRTQFNGETYNSKAEAEDEQAFAVRQAAGEIGGSAREVSIPLRGQNRGKRRVRAQIDWLVNEPRPHTCSKCGHVDPVMQLVLKDTKGFITSAWETKRRLLEAQLGITIEVIQH
jgi:hypothetical protein